MFRRGPGLVRAAATTAVIAGTAGAVRHRQDVKYANQAAAQQADAQAGYEQQQMQAQIEAQQAQIQQMQAQQAAAAAPAPAAPPAAMSMDEKLAKLEKLGQLQQAGILTPEEFAAQKAAILAS